MHVCICACVTLQVKKWELESSVSPCDVGFWCFPNQGSGTSSDEDVMSQSGFLSYSSRGLLFCHFLFVCAVYFHLFVSVSVLYLSLSATCLFLSLSLSLLSPLVALQGSRRLPAFFYEWDALFTLWELFLCRWWTQTVTTLPVLLPSFLWLAKVPLSMATDLR